MTVQFLEQRSLNGLKVRTNNQDEMTEGKGKIGPLWQDFYQTIASELNENAQVFGVYTNYDTDHTGPFDVYAATSKPISKLVLDKVDIQAGNYLKFQKTGEMPQAVIDLWGEVWAYFSSRDCQHKRAYTTDFEFYKGTNEVEIAIAIK